MSDNHRGCMICGKPLKYADVGIEKSCILCGKSSIAKIFCEHGHYVCDGCHSKKSALTMKDMCLEMHTSDPVEIFLELVSSPDVHLHGPEHHILVGSALITAIHNMGEDFDLASALDEMKLRGKQAPGGMCGYWGCCGAAVSCGMAFSILSECTPLSEESWGLSNRLVSYCLDAIGSVGGPRCCKRDGLIALNAAVSFLNENIGSDLPVHGTVKCTYSSENRQCIGNRCPFHN